MIDMLRNWKGTIEVNGVLYENVEQFTNRCMPLNEIVSIKLYPKQKQTVVISGNNVKKRVTVKKYMTQKANPGFDFMQKWNNDNPMPLRTMVGTVEKETKGMVYMKLHGDIYTQQICTCMKCGKRLTNKVSQYFGIGPECGNHNYVNPFNTEEELKNAVTQYRKKLQAITWEGWIIKSAITEQEDVA